MNLPSLLLACASSHAASGIPHLIVSVAFSCFFSFVAPPLRHKGEMRDERFLSRIISLLKAFFSAFEKLHDLILSATCRCIGSHSSIRVHR